MRALASRIAALALCLAFATAAHATMWPSGLAGPQPGGPCADTLDNYFLEDITQMCGGVRPTLGDTVLGIPGIITAISPPSTNRGFWVQDAGGGPYSGMFVFCSSSDYFSSVYAPPYTNPLDQTTGHLLALGDAVELQGDYQEFGGSRQVRSGGRTTWRFPRWISSSNPLPAFHDATPHEVELGSDPGVQAQWNNCLVRLTPPAGNSILVRRSGIDPAHQGNGVTGNSMILVVEPDFPTDSVLVDGFYNSVGVLPEGTEIDLVQGVYYQASVFSIQRRRIALRSTSDIQGALPPAVTDAYVTDNDKIRLIFDRPVSAATATPATQGEREANYSFDTGNICTNAVFEGGSGNKVVILTFDNTVGLQNGDVFTITVSNLVGDPSGLPVAQTDRSMRWGKLSVAEIQDPDDVRLGGDPCADGSRRTSATGTSAGRFTYSGVCISPRFASSTYYIMDPIGPNDSAQRHGMTVFAPTLGLTIGHIYTFVSVFQEFDGTSGQIAGGETEGSNFVYTRDDGAVSAPTARLLGIETLTDESCDVNEDLATAEDYEGCLVKISNVKVMEERGPNLSFLVRDGEGDGAAEILVNQGGGDVAWTFDPAMNQHLNVTGILKDDPTPSDPDHPGYTKRYVLNPRSNADFEDLGFAGVDGGPGKGLRLSVSNPARKPQVSFTLPKDGRVELAVYDLSGRKIVTIMRGNYPAGDYVKAWDGRDESGQPARAGVYFYGLKGAGEFVTTRGVKLD